MKINDKYLIPFAKSANQVDKEGYLMKKGDKNFSQRYFVLKGNLLFYFEKKNDKEPLGVIILEGSTMELTESEFDQHYCFKIAFPSRSYTLSAESQSTMESWLKSLACGSVDYIKLMVAELERQLDETTIHSTHNVFTSNRFNNSSSLNANVPTENVSNTTTVPQHRQHISTPPRHRHARQPTQNQKRAFSSLHNEFGDNIVRHQESRWSIHETNRPRNIPPLSVVKQYGIIDF